MADQTNNKKINVESLKAVRNALGKYYAVIKDEIVNLSNAANACEVAMGSDDVCKEYLPKLEKSIKDLKTIAKDLEEQMKKIKKEIEILTSMGSTKKV